MSSNPGFSAMPLCNADTYNEWQSAFIAFLYSKDLESYVKTDPTKLSDADDLKNSKHRCSYMYWSCLADCPTLRLLALICSGNTSQTCSL
jgi:hypothetical protein